MPTNRLLDRLAAEYYRTLSEQYDDVLTRCEDEQRRPV